jgi:hypothetical protein
MQPNDPPAAAPLFFATGVRLPTQLLKPSNISKQGLEIDT